jgi:hypothetical protein
MGEWTLIIQATGPHHVFEREGDYHFKRDTQGCLIPLATNAEVLAREFVETLTGAGHTVEVARLQVGGHESLLDPPER